MKKPQALVIDTGIAVEHARRLSEKYDVKYWTHYFSAYPHISDFIPGYGFEEIEKVDNIGNYIDSSDLICTFDIGYGDIIHYLRTHGKVCFGAGLGEKMETDRWWMKEQLKKNGLPVTKTAKVRGTQALRRYIQENRNVYVKLNTFRGDLETLYCPDYETVSTLIDYLDIQFGGLKDVVEFIVEHKIENGDVEVGVDYIFSPSQGFLMPGMWGVEIQSAYIGRWDTKIPKWFRTTEPFLRNLMKEMDYRGFVSTEQILIDTKTNYLLDMTTRIPLPLGHIFTSAIINYCEVIEKVAKDEPVIPLITHRWWGCLPVYSEELKNMHVMVRFPEKVKDHIKITGGYRVGDHIYSPKGNHTVCSVIAGGDSLEEVKRKLIEVAKSITAVRVDVNEEVLDKIEEKWKILEEKYGAG